MALTNEGGIFAIINGIIEGLPEVAGKVGGKMMDFAEGVGNAIESAAGSVFGAVSNVSIGSSISPEPAAAVVRAPEIAPARGAHDVDPAELFTFSAPTFNAIPMAARATGQGASV